MNSAIIVAAGLGKRFGGFVPKQFAEILGKPVLIHTLERFAVNSLIDEIILVLAESEIEAFSSHLKHFDSKKTVKVTAGGETRAGSVQNGLKAVGCKGREVVAIHDGARPVIPQGDISNVLRKAGEVGAACLVAPFTDTVKTVAEGEIKGTVDRMDLRRALTPQCFRYELLEKAFEEFAPVAEATDDCGLIERLGHPIAIVDGSPFNIKITYEEDLETAEVLLRRLLESERGGVAASG